MRTALIVLFGASLLVGLAGCNGNDDEVTAGSTNQREMWSYTVLPGDSSYAQIAQRVYGDQSKGDLIAGANPRIPEASLNEGVDIKVPALEGVVGPPRGCKRIGVY